MRVAAFALASLLASAAPSLAAEATTAQAQQLVDVFHRYLGGPLAGKADHVRVEPQGEAYRVSIAIDTLMSLLAPFGVSLDPQTLSFLVQPLPDGTWRVSEVAMPSPSTVHIREQTVTYKIDGVSLEGIYDPALAAFASFNETIGSMSTEASRGSGHSTAQYGKQVVQGTASGAGDGGVNVQVQQTMDGFSSRQTMPMPGAAAGAMPQFDVSYAIESGTGSVTMEALRAPQLLDLWAYAVAHLQAGAPAIDATELKAQLTGLLPLFSHFDETGAVTGMTVGTPFGEFGVHDMSGRMALSGLAQDSSMSFNLQLASATYPQALLPSWAPSFVPTQAEVGFDVSGLNLDAAARKVIASIAPNEQPVLSNGDVAAAMRLAVPDDGAKLTLSSVHVDGPILKVAVDGELMLRAPKPTGTIMVRVSGLDQAVSTLQQASNDPTAAKMLGMLTIAGAMARRAEDGGTEFAVVFADNGAVTVNGQTVVPGSQP